MPAAFFLNQLLQLVLGVFIQEMPNHLTIELALVCGRRRRLVLLLFLFLLFLLFLLLLLLMMMTGLWRRHLAGGGFRPRVPRHDRWRRPMPNSKRASARKLLTEIAVSWWAGKGGTGCQRSVREGDVLKAMYDCECEVAKKRRQSGGFL